MTDTRESKPEKWFPPTLCKTGYCCWGVVNGEWVLVWWVFCNWATQDGYVNPTAFLPLEPPEVKP